VREHRKRDVTLSALEAPHFVFFETGLALRLLERHFDRPAAPGDCGQYRAGRAARQRKRAVPFLRQALAD